MPWMAMFIPENRISRGRINRSSTLVTTPSSIQASPTEQALPRCSLAVSKSIAMVFKRTFPTDGPAALLDAAERFGKSRRRPAADLGRRA
jgi:hypothetical protein